MQEGFSIPAQKSRLVAYGKAMETNLHALYVDEAFSAGTTRRPAYQKMMEHWSQWDWLIVTKGDRLHRNKDNSMPMFERMRRDRKRFTSLSESIDTQTPSGRFTHGIFQLKDTNFLEELAVNVRRGMLEKVAEAGPRHTVPWFGYNLRHGRLVIEIPEARWYKWAASKFLQGDLGLEEIARELAARAPRKRWGRRINPHWDCNAVRRMFRNPSYLGVKVWGLKAADPAILVGTHQPLIDLASYLRIQRQLDVKGRGGDRRVEKEQALLGQAVLWFRQRRRAFPGRRMVVLIQEGSGELAEYTSFRRM